MEHVATGRTISMCRKNGVLVLHSDARPSAKPSRSWAVGVLADRGNMVAGGRREEGPWTS